MRENVDTVSQPGAQRARTVRAVVRQLERRWDRWYRPLAFALTVLIIAGGVVLILTFWPANADHAGEDLVHYLDGVRRWWDAGSPYLPDEIARNFDYEVETFLHPPISLPFFALWLVVPAILWWTIPVAITAALVLIWRPEPWTWPVMAFGLAQPQFHQALLWGNSNLWVMAALGLGLAKGWPAALILIKPSLAFLALVGYRRRSWWAVVVALGLASIPFGFLWIEWIRVVLNSPADADYGLRNLPWVAIPLVAWAGRSRDPEPSARAQTASRAPGSEPRESTPQQDLGQAGPRS